jgi:hypothetical protein
VHAHATTRGPLSSPAADAQITAAARAATQSTAESTDARARPRRSRAILLAAIAALSVCGAAHAHEGGGAAKGYSSVVTSVEPAGQGIRVQVLDADDRLRLVVEQQHVVIVHGYQGEPYLRFAPDGVFRNRRSPATYVNDDRYGRVQPPADADASAPPVWEKVASGGRAYEWHDHRIHWMSESYPPAVTAALDEPRHVLDWTVGGTVDGRPLVISGRLDYAPLPGTTFPRVLLVPLALLLVAALVVPLLRRRGRRSGRSHATEPPTSEVSS